MAGHGIFHAYGLFWRRDQIDWLPGSGKSRRFRLLGRIGTNIPKLQIADFRKQQGIYILYGNYGPYYIGMTWKQTLGKRLRDHLFDGHQEHWDKFSWFGFRRVLEKTDKFGLHEFGEMPTVRSSDPKKAMEDIEALLIKATATWNINQMNFAHAQQWMQIEKEDIEYYLKKLKL